MTGSETLRKTSLKVSRPALAALLVSFGPLTPAHAHSAVAGMNAFYAGLFHPFQNLPHLLVLVGLGIFLGQGRGGRIGWPTLSFAVCAALTLLLTSGVAGRPPAPTPGWLMGLALCFGGLIAWAPTAPAALRVALAGLAAIAVGLDSGVDGDPPWATLALMLLGTWISASALVANIAYYVSECPDSRWLNIGIRVLGSWMAAASILVLAFYLKSQTSS